MKRKRVRSRIPSRFRMYFPPKTCGKRSEINILRKSAVNVGNRNLFLDHGKFFSSFSFDVMWLYRKERDCGGFLQQRDKPIYVFVVHRVQLISVSSFSEYYVDDSSPSMVIIEKDGVFICSTCGKIYQRKYTAIRHIKFECGSAPQFQCRICCIKFKRSDTLKSHLYVKHKIVWN